ncbi:DUF1801 domain-containing protein [Aquimarina gracilis]|uniref:DUF1801 domain-containing protein n=1 Tax=Aquimarina gracilis TaxID=874422 RepID=A0ABU6A1M0_9FLAO|nr:DUF1801 domain-containing protein [Aquimarina gracilis]MEB3348057.1 DUF1801 domain-containing protein [Aquimarina gracilis]
MKYSKSIDEYIENNSEWLEEITTLRNIMCSTEMKETIKWGAPTYTIDGKNVVGLGAFKSYVGIWFHQGVFLKDQKNKLINAQEGKTKGLRQWRFSSLSEIDEDLVLKYVQEAIQNQKEGKEIKPEKSKTLTIPIELDRVLTSDTDLKKSFDQLTPFKQKEFIEYIATAKREATRLSRLEKITPMILEGVGLNDKYR